MDKAFVSKLVKKYNGKFALKPSMQITGKADVRVQRLGSHEGTPQDIFKQMKEARNLQCSFFHLGYSFESCAC
jgi:hypothetical protein